MPYRNDANQHDWLRLCKHEVDMVKGYHFFCRGWLWINHDFLNVKWTWCFSVGTIGIELDRTYLHLMMYNELGCHEDNVKDGVSMCKHSGLNELSLDSLGWFSLQFYIYIYSHIPAPSKGCQMVPKGCQFTIPWGLIGTPLKVQVVILYTLYTWTLQGMPNGWVPGCHFFHATHWRVLVTSPAFFNSVESKKRQWSARNLAEEGKNCWSYWNQARNQSNINQSNRPIDPHMSF